MELLVEEEVDRRLEQLSESHRVYLNRMEIIAYALNQLPALYATGESGLTYQRQQGETRYAAKVQQAVQQALAAVLRDPIINYAPLKFHAPAGLRDVLKRIRKLLHHDQIDWETLPDILENLVRSIPRGTIIAAVNAGFASSSQEGQNNPTFGHVDDLNQDDITGIVGVPNPTIIPVSDKPWKRFRDNLATSGGSTAVSNAWDDARYWK
jgi:hypothetical protein